MTGVRSAGDKANASTVIVGPRATSIADSQSNDGIALAKALAADHRTLSAACAKAVSVAQKASDEASADLLIGRIEAHDKTAWMLEAVAK